MLIERLDEMSDAVREQCYREWIAESVARRHQFPLLRFEMDAAELAKELQAGGVTLSHDCLTTVLDHRDKVIIVEVPWHVGNRYAMADIVQHAAFLLARMRTHSPKRIRISDETGEFAITVVD